MTDENMISERGQTLLKLLIEYYIREGQPVASQTLARDKAISLSSASVRSVLADLEKRGYLVAPHTSAGRIPTERGYRLFVDSLLSCQPLATELASKVELGLRKDAHLPNTLKTATSLLSELTQLAGIVTVPTRKHQKLRYMEFLPLSEQRVLVVLVLNEQEVHNRIVTVDRSYSTAELQLASNYINQNFAGVDLDTLSAQIINDMQRDQAELSRLTELMVKLADSELLEQSSSDYLLEGKDRLLNVTDDLSSVRTIFEAFAQKRLFLDLVNQSVSADGVQIFIGEESGYHAFKACSVVTSSYRVNGEVVGILGVIGPQRMNYERVISVVDITAKLLSAALSPDKN